MVSKSKTTNHQAAKSFKKVQFESALRYFKGAGVGQDFDEAIRLFKLAAANHDSAAHAWLGHMYYNGIGVTKDLNLAFQNFRKAAEMGNLVAQTNLGLMYLNGKSVTRNYVEARKWYQQAAKRGCGSAHNSLGEIYEKGLGVEIDYTEALRCYDYAIKESIGGATENKKRCETKLAKETQRLEEEKRKQLRKRELIVSKIHAKFESDFLGADEHFKRSGWIETVALDDYRKEKANFVKEWVLKNVGKPIDSYQAEAISETSGHTKVVARAGSGKTYTLVVRAFFLINHCRIASQSMLVLAFNRKAVYEIRSRLKRLLNKTRSLNTEVELPHVMTFHSLAYWVVHPDPDEELVYDSDENPVLKRVVHQQIEALLQVPSLETKMRNLMKDFFKDDWDRILRSGHGWDKKEYIDHLRSPFTQMTYKGDFVKSYGEKAIANLLFEHGFEYRYEQGHRWDGRTYRPDFTLTEYKVVIEYFGLAGNKEYDKKIVEKRNYWARRRDYKFIELYPKDIASENYISEIKKQLRHQGAIWRKMSEDELWVRIKDNAIGGFTSTTTQFINRARQLFISANDLRRKIESHGYLPDDIHNIEKRYYEIACIVYDRYLSALGENKQEDFNGLMQKAVKKIESGIRQFSRGKSEAVDIPSLKHVLIDEFQDFSYLFCQLLHALQKQNQSISVFGVGDDWQAINKFAGSDLEYFNNFEQYVGQSRLLTLPTNYRSSKSIVDVGNELMEQYGVPSLAHSSAKGEVQVVNTDELPNIQSEIEQMACQYNLNSAALVRVLNELAEKHQEAVILCRTRETGFKKNNRLLQSLRSKLPEHEDKLFSISTSHSYKGLEKDAVVVLLDEYPFFHPYWVFGRLFGDSIESIIEDEQRLLYVAMTRAKSRLLVITSKSDASPYLEPIQNCKSVNEADWVLFPFPDQDRFLTVRINGTNFATKHVLDLGNYGFTYNRQDFGLPYWQKIVERVEFNANNLQCEKWFLDARRLTSTGQLEKLEIEVFTELPLLIYEITIENGKSKRVDYETHMEAKPS